MLPRGASDTMMRLVHVQNSICLLWRKACVCKYHIADIAAQMRGVVGSDHIAPDVPDLIESADEVEYDSATPLEDPATIVREKEAETMLVATC